MRCIETHLADMFFLCLVLINRNMRCIETRNQTIRATHVRLINRNMRCIETTPTPQYNIPLL